MLRRKLLIRIGLLITAFVAGAVGAIWLLQDALSDIDRTNADAAVLIGGIQSVGSAVTSIQVAREGPGDAGSSVADSVKRLQDAMDGIGAHHAAQGPDGPAAPAYNRLRGLISEFLERNTDPQHARSIEALTSTVAVQAAVQNLGAVLRTHVADEQASLGRHFRALVLGLTLAALVMVNVAILVLLRTAQVVLNPVAALVDGSRELAAEHFDHRVTIAQNDEFGELAHAYNHLAEQLQAIEERKAEALRQLAVTLNHDLNNAMAVIELQLGLLDRQAGGNPTLAKHLREIRCNLARMTGTVASLKNIRRVVLTDYSPGQKMLDLERSVAPGPTSSTPTGHAA
jgi:nitrate/nitrite-specific signal transduction histidine kinase